MTAKPALAITHGDPCGIGPEVLARALATGQPQAVCTPIVVGSVDALRMGARIAGVELEFRRIDAVAQSSSRRGSVDVIDSGALDAGEIELGVAKASCGRANGQWLQVAAALAANGEVAGTVMGPVNADALKLGNVGPVVPGTDPRALYLTLLSGPLRVVHVFDHVPLEVVCSELSVELVLAALRNTHAAIRRWSGNAPRIGVAGLNPHAKGRQERDAIAPAVLAGQAEGIDADGPIAPDTVFRHCIDGRYDVVLAMCHDQGHIAMKTWGFVGNCAMFLGAPQLFMTVGHGTAYDIVGQGIARHEMMLAAIMQGASLAAGKGFATGEGDVNAG